MEQVKHKPVVISDEDWEKYFLPKKNSKFTRINGDPKTNKAPLGKPAYYHASKRYDAKCLRRADNTYVCIYLPIDSFFEARKQAAIALGCEPDHVMLRGPYLSITDLEAQASTGKS